MAEDTDSLKPITFWEMLNSAARIVIPVIQRDYAQGRDTTQAKDIRTAFATELDTAFRDAKPLSLDFVYLVDNDEEKRIPVDGQQRLTTLFLFHLYHLPLTAEAEKRLGRFTYEVRESTTTFCNELVRSRKAWREAVKDDKTPQKAIRDQPWFLAAWEQDPTVMGMLRMLDAIHEACKGKGPLPDGWWERSTVTFLPFTIENADPDETYRKLNARGKPLTPFENLKAAIDGKQVPDWANKIDAEWLDTIWALYAGDPNPAVPCDTALLSVTLALLLTHHATTAEEESVKALAPHVQAVFNVLRGEKATLPNSERERLCPNGDATWKQFLVDGFTRVTNTEDTIAWMTAPWDAKRFPLADKLAQRENERLTYPDLALFYAYCLKPEGHDWRRVIHNIVENATIDSAETFVSAIRAFKKLAEGDLREALKKASFAQKQCEEEADKLDLVKNNAWREPIEEAEKLPWQKGRILFLLAQCKSDNNTHDLKTFKSVLGDFEKKLKDERNRREWLRETVLPRLNAEYEKNTSQAVYIPCSLAYDGQVNTLKPFLYHWDSPAWEWQSKALYRDCDNKEKNNAWRNRLDAICPKWCETNDSRYVIRTWRKGEHYIYLYTQAYLNDKTAYRIDKKVDWWYELKATLGNRLELTNGWTTLDSGSWVQAKYGNYEVALLEGGIQLKVGQDKWLPKEPGKEVPEDVLNDPEKLNAWLNDFVSDPAREDTPEDGQ